MSDGILESDLLTIVTNFFAAVVLDDWNQGLASDKGWKFTGRIFTLSFYDHHPKGGHIVRVDGKC